MYEHIAQAVYGAPWAIIPEKLGVIVSVLEERRAGIRLTTEEAMARVGTAAERPVRQQAGAVAVIPVFGVLAQRVGMLEAASGGVSTETVGAQLRQALNDPGVKAVILNVDSPGGAVFGIPELAAEIRAARGGAKPIIASANSMAASAAYWLGSQADELVVTPGGMVGSIGVITAHVDLTAQMEAEGRRVTVVEAGRYKAERSPYRALTEEARAAMQAEADSYFAMFTADVARGRGRPVAEVRGGFGEGRVVGAAEAVRLGMADRVEPLADTLRRLGANPAAGRPMMAAAEPPPVTADDGEVERRRRRLALLRQ